MSYALRVQSLGAGVQSSTITEMIIEGELDRVDAVLFADTGDEPAYVYEQVEYLRGRLAGVGIPLVTVSAGNIVQDVYGGGRFAAMPLFSKQLTPVNGFGLAAHNIQIGRLKRQCTANYKIEPIQHWIREELLRRGLAKRNKVGAILVTKGVMIESQLGISLDEVQRMKPSQVKWITNTFPLIDLRMKRQGCVEWLKSRGLPIPKKSSCRKCPYHTLAYFREMRDESPGDWQTTIQFDRDLRNGTLRLAATARGELYLTEECIPLEQIDLSTAQERGQMDICDEGYCLV